MLNFRLKSQQVLLGGIILIFPKIVDALVAFREHIV